MMFPSNYVGLGSYPGRRQPHEEFPGFYPYGLPSLPTQYSTLFPRDHRHEDEGPLVSEKKQKNKWKALYPESPEHYITLSRAPRPSEESSSSHPHPPTPLEDDVESTSPYEMAGLCDTSSADTSSRNSYSWRGVPADDIEKNKRKLRKKAEKRTQEVLSDETWSDSDSLQDLFSKKKLDARNKSKKRGDDVKIHVGYFKKRAKEFEADFQNVAMKIHRFPASVAVAGQYINPMVVSIGPYHYGRGHLVEMDKLKIVAVHHFIVDSGHSHRDLYQAVFTVAPAARNLYPQRGWMLDETNFVEMLVRDACFLLQYIRLHTAPHEMDASLACCLTAHQACINIDIMLLENQLPWLVVKTVMNFMPVAVEEFCARMCGYFKIRKDLKYKPFVMDDRYEPPHLLAILRSCAVGRIPSGVPPPIGLESMSTIPSAVELEEIGIRLKASKTAKFVDMGIMKRTLFSKLYLPPLSLDKTRACWLANMVAFEVCTSSVRTEDENIAVCSYLCVLAMLMSREEDVQELRKKRLLQGELSNKETLEFFKSLTMYLYGGPLYYQIMTDIERYKVKRWMWMKVHEFVYKNFKTIITVFSVVGVVAGIFKALMSIGQHHKNTM